MRFLLTFICSIFLGFASQAQSDTISLPSGLKYVILQEGKGFRVSQGAKVLVHYTGRLADGKVFDTSANGKPLKFKAGVGQVIKGWDEMLLLMRVGDEVEVRIPAELAYGERGVLNPNTGNYIIPPDTDLYFRMRVVRVDR